MVSNTFPKSALMFAGFGMVAGAIFHIACLIGGPGWMAFAGAPNWAVESVRQGTWMGPAVTLLIAALLIFWALYAFSGAGKIRKLPCLKIILATTALILILRGLVFLPLLPNWKWDSPLYAFHGILSLFVLAMGLAYALGAYDLVKEQRHKKPRD